jgi:hypothetical protein
MSPEHKATSSTQRPLGFFPADSKDSVDAHAQNVRGDSGSWRHWEKVSANRPEPEKSIEQETLV